MNQKRCFGCATGVTAGWGRGTIGPPCLDLMLIGRLCGSDQLGTAVARGCPVHMSHSMPTQTCPILLVEDDASLQQSLRDFLEDNGFNIHTAGSRAQGQEMLRALRPAVCLLDMNLPDGSGLDLLKLIVAENLPVRVIVMSAFPQPRLLEQFPKRVLAAMMTKPVSPLLLLECVDKITRGGSDSSGQASP